MKKRATSSFVFDFGKIHVARVHVPVHVSDGFSNIDTLVIAGMIDTELDAATLSTAKPRPGWWLFTQEIKENLGFWIDLYFEIIKEKEK